LSKRKSFFYCHECKKILEKIEDLLFVETNGSRGFCSEGCISEFYSPLIRHFEKEEFSLRKEFASETADDKKLDKYREDQGIAKRVLEHPNEVWVEKNELQDEFCTLIAHIEDKEEKPFYLIILCFLYSDEPSLIFFQTTTYSENIVEYYRAGKKYQSLEEYKLENDHNQFETAEFEEGLGGQRLELPEEYAVLLAQKKSDLLAELMNHKMESDIPFEEYALYNDYLSSTIDLPDEVYQHEDEDGDTIHTFIRTYEKNGASFFYIVICLKIDADTDEVVAPIIAFPSLDPNLYQKYRQGKSLTETTLN